jgi:hypothetical protein
MIFKPSIVARMWDTWLYYHEGMHYLFYLHNSRADTRWDSMSVDGPGYVGFLTAVAKDGPPGLCGTAGMVVSEDGRHFRAALPAIEPGFWGDRVEVGAVEKFGDRYYMLLGVGSMPLGARHLSRLPAGEGGMMVLASEKQQGPYRLMPGQPLLLGSSPNLHTYGRLL